MSEPKDGPDADEAVDHDPGDNRPELSADEGEPNVEPFAGDDDIASGHLTPPGPAQ